MTEYVITDPKIVTAIVCVTIALVGVFGYWLYEVASRHIDSGPRDGPDMPWFGPW